MSKWPLVPASAAFAAAFLVSPARAEAGGPASSQFDLAASPSVKLGVRGAGWVRIGQPALVAAGLDPLVNPAQLCLYADDVEQGIRVTGNGDATFDPDEAIEFYGVGRDTLWTDTRTYWLTTGAAGKPIPLVANPGGGASPPSFTYPAVSRPRTLYYAPLLNGDASNFFGDVVSTTAVTETISLSHPDATQPATLKIGLQGVTTGLHQVAIALNGQPPANCGFVGEVLQTCVISPAAVVDGANQIALVAGGDAPDYSLLSSVEIDYPHLFTADGDELSLTVPPATRIAIDGFSSANLRVVDVTDPDSPVELVTGVSFNGATYAVGVSTPGDTAPHALYAFDDAAVPAPPAFVTANQPSSWSTSPGGELVILSNAQFIEAVRPLADRRTQEGWSVQLIDLQDVYDEFGGGDETVFAVRDFLQYAHTHWATPPRFVLLVGDASVDPRNFLGQGAFDFAPTKLIDTAEMETASDDWFVDWNSDGVPDIAIGRISVRTAAEAATVTNKILGYQGTADLPQGALFVADQTDGILDFEATTQASEAVVSGLLPVQSFFLSQPASTASALIADLNQGPFLVNYMGHGSVEVWDNLFSDDDATALTNPRLSIYVSMNCLNGFFQDVYTQSLAESLAKAPNGGAVAVWASSTLSSFDSQATLNQEFLERLTHTSLGEAAMAAKATISDLDAQRTWILFGDPTLFGTPGSKGGGPPGGTDGGVGDGDADAGAVGDGARPGSTGEGGSADAGMPDARGTPADGGSNGGARADAPAAGGADGGGCGCQLVRPRAGFEVTLVFLGLVVVAAARRGSRRGRRAQASRGER
jgi:hypothetical protein